MMVITNRPDGQHWCVHCFCVLWSAIRSSLWLPLWQCLTTRAHFSLDRCASRAGFLVPT